MSPRPDRRPDSRPDRGSRRPGGPSGSRPVSRPGGRPPGRTGPPRWREGRDSGGSREPGAGGEDRSLERGPAERGRYGRRPLDKPAFGGRSFDRDRPREDRGAPQGRGPSERRGPSAFSSPRPGGDRFAAGRFAGPRGGDARRDERPGGGRVRPAGSAPFRPGGRPSFSPGGRPSFSSGGRPSFRPAAAPSDEAGGRGPAGAAEGESFAAAAPSDLIWGRHSAQAVLESGRPVHRIWCTPEMRFSPRFLQLLREAKSSGVLVEEVTWARLGQISGGAVHQGIVLQPAAAETLDLPSLIDGCRGVGESPLLIAVDGLTDPQNLGAIVRSAEALGAHGMVLPQRRNAGLTGSVAKVAAGALEHLPVARVVNLNRSLEALKQEGYRVVGLAAEGGVTLEEADLSGPLVVVTGSEGEGLSMLTRRSCDQLVRIPLRGSTPSLNASVATALLLYEIARRGWMHGLSGSAPAPRLVRPALPAPEPLAPVEEPAVPAAEIPEPESSLQELPLGERLVPETAAAEAPSADIPEPEIAAEVWLPEQSAPTAPEPASDPEPAPTFSDPAEGAGAPAWTAPAADADPFVEDIRL